jgi:hypothetical protein
MVPAPPQAVTLPTPAPPTMATTNLKSERWQLEYTEATVGDMFQGDLASSTTQAQAWAHSATHLISAELSSESAHAYSRRSSPPRSPICRGSGVHPHPHPRFAGDRGSIPAPSPICGGSGVHPRPHPRFAGDRGSSPSPVPIGGSVPCFGRDPFPVITPSEPHPETITEGTPCATRRIPVAASGTYLVLAGL